MSCIDYARSFVCSNGGGENAPQFWIESRCVLIDEREQTRDEFYQCASCKSEHTFAEKDLFQDPNYDFLPVFSEADIAIFRRHAYCNDNYLEYRKANATWGGPRFVIRNAETVRELDSAEIVQVALTGLPFVSQTETWDEETGMRAIIECPVKTMNANPNRGIWQVDTGPVIYPDLSRRYLRKIEALRLAFVAFNGPDFADFVIEQPTEITEEGKVICKVHHYSGIVSRPAKNTVWVVGETEDGRV